MLISHTSRSTAIDELYLTVKPLDAKVGIAYFYCDYSDLGRQTMPNIMGSLIAQLSKQDLAFRSAVWKYFDSTHGAYGSGSKRGARDSP